MALSYCANYDPVQHLANSEQPSLITSCCYQQPEEEDIFCFNNNNESLQFSDSFINLDELFYSENNTTTNTDYLPFFSDVDKFISLTPEIFPLDPDFDPYPLYPKRQKTYQNPNHFTSGLYGHVSNPPVTVPEFIPELPVLVPEIPVPGAFSFGKADQSETSGVLKKQNNNSGGGRGGGGGGKGGVSLSVQSLAARERRRKITEKTQELGKLIPGGHRMNTAEMFQAASKYVKFLQAQVRVLQSIQERKESFETEEMQTLLGSKIIQEKLYSEEKCLVPKEYVETLANDPEIQSKPVISDGIDELLNVKD